MAPGTGRPPLVSVVLPTYDRPAMLRSALESVAAQTYDPIEVVVVDDGSEVPATDVVADVPRSARMDITVCRHRTNRGANAARNTGIAAAIGAYVAFLDDDDSWHPTKIERQVARLEAASDAVGVVFTGQRYVNVDGNVTNVSRPADDDEFMAVLVHGGHLGSFSNVMVRAEVFDKTGYLDERFPCWQDREWYFRLAHHYDFETIPALLTVRRFTEAPQISDRFEARRDVAYPLLLDKHRDAAASLGPDGERAFLASTTRALALAALTNHYYRDAIQFLCRSLQYRPTDLSIYLSILVASGGVVTHAPARVGKRLVNRYFLDTDDRALEPPSLGSAD